MTITTTPAPVRARSLFELQAHHDRERSPSRAWRHADPARGELTTPSQTQRWANIA